MRTYKVIRIEWLDSTSHTGWSDREHLKTHHPCMCVSCGVQVKTERGSVGVTHSICENKDVCDTIIIPRKAIQKMEKITTFKA